VSALLDLVAEDVEGEQGDLVQGAYQLLMALTKVRGSSGC
jgi:hypothetical protein